MKNKGYYGIGCINLKTGHNFGSLFRTAQILDADFIFLIGTRFYPQASDTMASWKHVPTFIFKTFEDFNNHRPFDCPLIGVEMHSKAIELSKFLHPKRSCYLLGAEDNGLTKEAIDHCQQIVYLPGERSMNVAVAGSIIMYDRYVKLENK